MKKRICILLFVVAIVFSCNTLVSATGMNTPRLSTYSVNETEKATFVKKTNLVLIQDDNYKLGIKNFDVNEDGTIAIAVGSGSNCIVYVYDSTGVFQYGFNFYSSGDFGVSFYENNVAIYFLRGNTVAIYDYTGNCLDVQKLNNPNRDHIQTNQILERTEKQLLGKTYLLERDINIGDAYSRLVIIDEDGERNVIYDISTQHSVGNIMLITGIVCFFAVVVTIVLVKGKRDPNKKNNT